MKKKPIPLTPFDLKIEKPLVDKEFNFDDGFHPIVKVCCLKDVKEAVEKLKECFKGISFDEYDDIQKVYESVLNEEIKNIFGEFK